MHGETLYFVSIAIDQCLFQINSHIKNMAVSKTKLEKKFDNESESIVTSVQIYQIDP